MSPNIFLVIPRYNVENNFPQLLSEIRRFVPDVRIVVVDDGSTDINPKLINDQNIVLLRHRINLGQWAALRTGFMYSLLNGADIIASMDADGQHHPADLPNILDPVVRGETDVVLGSRFLIPNNGYMKKYRNYGIKLFNFLFKCVSGVNLSDCTSGFKVYRAEVIKRILPSLKENQYGALESLYYITKHKFRIKETAIQNIHSEKSYKGSIKYGYNLLRILLHIGML